MLFLMTVVFFVIHYSTSSYYFSNAEENYKESFKQEESKRSAFLNDALEQIDYALKLRPNNAKALDLKAEIIYRKWWQNPDGKFLDDSKQLQRAKELHLQALSIRKDWAFTVAQLARIEAHKPVLDDEFFKRFDQVYELGRFESAIALDMMRIGISRWSELNDKAREKTVEFTRVSIEQKRNDLKFIRNLLLGFDLFDYFCSELSESERQKVVCNK